MIRTVTGMIEKKDMGITLSHEHIMVGFIPGGKTVPSDLDRKEVIDLILPLLLELKKAGGHSFVDCSPEYLGRDPVLLKDLSVQSGINVLTNTGFYKEPYLPDFVFDMSVEDLAAIWTDEANKGIGDSNVRPGFIKIALNTERLIPIQEKILKAAMLTSNETGLIIASHTIGGEAIMHSLEIMEADGFDPERFIWVRIYSHIRMK